MRQPSRVPLPFERSMSLADVLFTENGIDIKFADYGEIYVIRSETDRGVVVILDKRVLTKRYGPLFINSLPQCTQRTGSMQNLAREATTWLNL